MAGKIYLPHYYLVHIYDRYGSTVNSFPIAQLYSNFEGVYNDNGKEKSFAQKSIDKKNEAYLDILIGSIGDVQKGEEYKKRSDFILNNIESVASGFNTEHAGSGIKLGAPRIIPTSNYTIVIQPVYIDFDKAGKITNLPQPVGSMDDFMNYLRNDLKIPVDMEKYYDAKNKFADFSEEEIQQFKQQKGVGEGIIEGGLSALLGFIGGAGGTALGTRLGNLLLSKGIASKALPIAISRFGLGTLGQVAGQESVPVAKAIAGKGEMPSLSDLALDTGAAAVANWLIAPVNIKAGAFTKNPLAEGPKYIFVPPSAEQKMQPLKAVGIRSLSNLIPEGLQFYREYKSGEIGERTQPAFGFGIPQDVYSSEAKKPVEFEPYTAPQIATPEEKKVFDDLVDRLQRIQFTLKRNTPDQLPIK
jgi:hypothetical protein